MLDSAEGVGFTSRVHRFAAHLALKVAALIAAVTICGGHWAALKTVAWAGMLWEYSRGASVTEAVVKTFNGKHPCKLCVSIDAGRQQEQKAPVSAQVKVPKFEAISTTPLSFRRQIATPGLWRVEHWFARTWREAPPTPPPLAA
jgi:hypothetical protein